MNKQTFLFYFTFILICACSSSKSNYKFVNSVNERDVQIYRDEYGVPHIFGKTDADVAYGLAWANAEDAFDWMQETMLAGSGKMAKYAGKDGAAVDFFNHFIGAEEIVEERFDKDIKGDILSYIEGYCQGVNSYAAMHPEKVIMKSLFPVSPRSMLKSYVVSMSFLVGASDPIADILEGNFPKTEKSVGSNAYAFAKQKTVDGETYLCSNPHFYAEGPLSFYEAHLHSEQGLNVHGAMFQGLMSVIMGNNEHLGYGMTYNHFDGVDIFKLKMVNKKKLIYELDGKEYQLKKRKKWLKVKLGKVIILPVKRTTYWSEIGPTLKSKDGNFYAFKFMANQTIRLPEQLYNMNKAQNFEAFKSALEIQALAMFNIVYADKEDNIFYITNGQIPKRAVNDTRDFEGVLDGSTSDAIWQRILTIDELPHVLNPSCGYVFNSNNSPYNATCESENVQRSNYHSRVALRDGENNRSGRIMELIAQKDQVTFDEFKSYKFDTHYPKSSKFLTSIAVINEIDADKYPDLKQPITWMQEWDLHVTNESVAAAWFARTLQTIFNKKGYTDAQFVTGIELTETEFIEALAATKANFEKNFGKLDVTKGELMRIIRGGKSFPDPGFPDLLPASYGKEYGNGILVPEYSDSYTHFVAFNADGPTRMETLMVYGPSSDTTNERSTIEMERYSKQQPKPMSLNPNEIIRDSSKLYFPR